MGRACFQNRTRLQLIRLESRETPSSTSLTAIGADVGAAPRVSVYTYFGPLNSTVSRQLVATFDAYDPAFHGGVRVTTGDVTGDGVPDLITAAGPGGGPHVKIFDGAALLRGQA